jgi:hypothetical protein
MRFARIGEGVGFFIDVYTTSKDPVFRARLLAELETVCLANRVPILIGEQPEVQGERAPERSLSMLVIDQQDFALIDIDKAMEAMAGFRSMILVHSDSLPGQIAARVGTVDGFFACKDLATLLQPIRQLTDCCGRIGIDLADFLTIWKNNLTRPMRVPLTSLQSAIKQALPFDGVLVSFSPFMKLAEIGDAVDDLLTFLPPTCDLVYQDFGNVHDDLCDVGVAYRSDQQP